MPIDFSTLKNIEILNFIDENFHRFASKKGDEFPECFRGNLEKNFDTIISLPEGFAYFSPGSPAHLPWPKNAELHFIYVSPEYEGRGIATGLLEMVKAETGLGVFIKLLCEGDKRKDFFQQRGFVIQDSWTNGETTYEMLLTRKL